MTRKKSQDANLIYNNIFIKILMYVSKLKFPKYPCYCFPLYMLYIYFQIECKRKKFEIKSIPSEVMETFVKECNGLFCSDFDNIVIVNNNFLKFLKIDKFCKIKIKREKGYHSRIIRVFGQKLIENVILSETLFYNLKSEKNERKCNIIPCELEIIEYAEEVTVALVNTQYEIINAVTNIILTNYFTSPKLVYKNDILVLSLKKYGPQFYYSNHKMNEIENVCFKVTKIKYKDGMDSNRGVFCVKGETILNQSANCQSFLPCNLTLVKNLNSTKLIESLINACPYGLEKYLLELEKGIIPFLIKKKIKLKPIFLIKGNKGSGKTVLLKTLARKLGMNLYKVWPNEIGSVTYAQFEIKLRNVFFKCKTCSPCILLINNFENFAKNNEGIYDQRMINFFKTELEVLFLQNEYPIILICNSNAKDIHMDLSRIFLETFTIESPNQKERYDILRWVIESKNLTSKMNLDDLAGKTHGFLFEDLTALVFYAEKNWFKTFKSTCSVINLREEDFQAALDLMQTSYTESLGAPKVPKVQWSDVGGLGDVKQEIIKTINLPLLHPKLLNITGLKRSGILLYGPPGTGKTLIAKAVATECNLSFLAVKGPELLNMYVGQSEQNVREVFEKARQASPCIIFFDELDSLAPNRGVSGDSGGVMDRVVSQLLAEMDGLNQSATLFIIGATNRPDLIDPALLRPGRFDKLLYVGPCTDFESKLGVLKALTRKFKLSKDAKLEEIVKVCPKTVTGADFYGICSNAWMSAVGRLIEKSSLENPENLTEDNVLVTKEDFLKSIKNIKPSVSAEDLLYFEKLRNELSPKK